jgi:Pyruvate/2-oxoacid:ferredoxin oxidoreductase delta subunit
MRLGEPDESGRRRPIPIEGSEFIIDAKVVITAIGELPDISFLPKNIKLLESGFILDGLKIFAGGDVATGAGTVVDAIASGKRAASAIQSHLRGEKEKGKEKEEERGGKEIAHFEGLNLAYFSKEKAQRMAKLPLKGRISTFREVNLGLSEKEGEREARRCFSCGVCNSCDNCLIFCPDVAVTKLDDKYEINYDYCKGCGICSLECPRSVISLIEEGR